MSNPFLFTVTDLGRFLGKSAVTLRGWERKGLIAIPRQNGDRKLTVGEVREAARVARNLGRISARRLQLVEASLTMLALLEESKK